MPPTKRKSGYDTSDPFIASGSHSPPPSKPTSSTRPSKRSKPTSFSSQSIPPQEKDSDGNVYWSISPTRRVTISDFKGKKMVSVREYYQKDEAWLPGKKGITMTLEQYCEFVKVLPQIEAVLGKEGESVGRPDYGGMNEGRGVGSENGDGGEEEMEEEEEERNGRKANIEATSDEDED